MISNLISNAPRPKLVEISNSNGLHGFFLLGRRIQRTASSGDSTHFDTDISKLWAEKLVRSDFAIEFEWHLTKSE